MSESRSKFTCPKCWKSMTVQGHDKASWNYDPKTEEYIQRFYVSCPCTQKIMQITNTMEPEVETRESSAISVSTKLLDQIDLFTKPEPVNS